MAKYYRVTITTQLLSTFKVTYSTNSNPTVFNHTAGIWDVSGAPYTSAINLTYNQLTDNSGLMVVVDDDVYRIRIEDENGYCTDCVSDIFGEAIVENNAPNQQNVYIYNYYAGSDGSSFPVNVNNPRSLYNITGGGSGGSGAANGVQNNSNQTIYVRLMAKTNSSGNHSFDAMSRAMYTSYPQNHLDGNNLVYIGDFGSNTNYYPSSTVSFNNPAYSGQQYYYILPPGQRIFAGINPNYYGSNHSPNVTYTFAFSTNISVSSTQTEITRYIS
jgi:hypothetical protein